MDDPIQYVTRSCFSDSKTDDHVVDAIFHCELKEAPGDLQVCPREVPHYYWLSHEDILKASNCPEWLDRYLSRIDLLTTQGSEASYDAK